MLEIKKNKFMIKIRILKKEDEKQLFNLAIKFLKKYLMEKITSRKLRPLIASKNYDKYLKKDIKRHMKMIPGGEITFVAEDKKKLIGYIYGRIEKRPKKVLDKCGFIEDWFVEEKYRGKKIGEMLYDKLIKWFKKKKCNCLETDTYPTNKLALKIYHKLGFIDKTVIMIKKI